MCSSNLSVLIQAASQNSPNYAAIHIARTYEHLADYIDGNHPNRWMITYRNGNDYIGAKLRSDHSNDIYPLSLASLQPIVIGIGDFLIEASFEYSMSIDKGKMEASDFPSEDAMIDIGKFNTPKLWEYLQAKLFPDNMLELTNSMACENWPYIRFNTQFKNEVEYSPLHVEFCIFKRNYLERDSDRMFLHSAVELTYDRQKATYYFHEELEPSDIAMGKHADFESACQALEIPRN